MIADRPPYADPHGSTMPILKIAMFPDDETVLRTRARPVLKITPGTRRLIEDMYDTMRHAAGVGLAAPQVYVSQRIFVYDVGNGPEALINPEILQASGDELAEEGCLSIPRLHGDVPRATRVVVSGLNSRGRRVRIEADEFLSRVFQHEIDHLNGVLFIDKVIKSTLHWITPEQEARRREAAYEDTGYDEDDSDAAPLMAGEPAALV